MVWNRQAYTEDDVQTMKAMRIDGFTSSEIGNQFGVSRNTVIGALRRANAQCAELGVKAAVYNQNVGLIRNCRDTVSRQNYVPNFPAAPRRVYKVQLPPEPVEDFEPRADMPGIAEIGSRDCRWPYGDPATDAFHLCGHKAQGSGSYCPHHHAMAYRSAAEVKRLGRISRAKRLASLVKPSRHGAVTSWNGII